MKVTLYTTHCPLCKVIEKELAKAGIGYLICEDMEKMKTLGINSVPIIDVDGRKIGFNDALLWARGVLNEG